METTESSVYWFVIPIVILITIAIIASFGKFKKPKKKKPTTTYRIEKWK